MKRSLSLILAIVLAFTSMLGVISFADSTEAEASVSISQANVEFGNTVYLLIAVDYTAVYETADAAKAKITITVDGKTLTPDDSVEAPAGTVGFKYVDLGAKNMGDVLEIKAFDGNTEADSTTYSILEYAIKAKDTSGDELLEATVDAMIAFGAAAQSAFNYVGDYDLSKEHGMAVVGGSVDGKYIAEVGAKVAPAPRDAIGSDATLYDMKFDAVALDGNKAMSMAAGYNRYFYYGGTNNYYGDPNLYSLDMDLYEGETKTFNFKYGATGEDQTQNLYLNTAGGKVTLVKSAPSPTTFQVHGASKWSAVGAEGSTYINDSIRYFAPGYMYLYNDAKSTISCGYNLNNSQKLNAKNDGCITFAFSIAKIAGVRLAQIGPRLRGSSDTKDVYYLWKAASSTSLTIKAGGDASNSSNIVKLKEVDVLNGAVPTAADFTTFYLVIDTVNETLTYYGEDGVPVSLALDKTPGNTGKTWSEWAENIYMNWSYSSTSGAFGGIIVNRLTEINGNPFA